MAFTTMAVLITPARVIPRLSARDAGQATDELALFAADAADLDRDVVREAILERAKASTFGFGRGVAIPHAAIPGLERPLGVFARLTPAQDFGAADEIPADLAFLLLSPAGDDPTHLRALACVARRLRDRDVAACLRSAKDAQALYVVLTSDAWREPDAETNSGHSATSSAAGLTNAAMCTSIGASC